MVAVVVAVAVMTARGDVGGSDGSGSGSSGGGGGGSRSGDERMAIPLVGVQGLWHLITTMTNSCIQSPLL